MHKALANHGRESLSALPLSIPLVAGIRRPPPFLARSALPLSALSLFQPSTCFAPSQPRLPRQTALFGSKALISSLVFSLSRHSLHNCIHTLSRASGVSSLNSLKVRLKSLANPQLAHDSLYNPLTPQPAVKDSSLSATMSILRFVLPALAAAGTAFGMSSLASPSLQLLPMTLEDLRMNVNYHH